MQRTNQDYVLQLLYQNVQSLREITSQIRSESISKFFDDLEQKTMQNSFYLTIVGQFKRGKSTLINSLLGSSLLPTGVLPLTSVITKIYYNPEVKIDVIFESGEKRTILANELEDYCTEKGNPKNIKGVECIEIGYPFQFFSKDLVIIDTPGIGSVYKHNTDVTLDFVDKSDAVVFVLSSDPPITEVEKAFLEKLSASIDKIFFVINKSDIVSEKELHEIVEFTKDVIEEITGSKNPNIFTISAKLALDGKVYSNSSLISKSGILELEEELIKFLAEEKEKVRIINTVKNLQRYIDMCKSYLQSSLNLKMMPLRSIEEKISMFDSFLSKIELNKDEIYKLFKVEINEILSKFDELLEKIKVDMINEVSKRIKKYYNNVASFSRKKQKELLEKYLEKSIIDVFESIKGNLEKFAEEQFAKVISKYVEKINELLKQIQSEVAEMFGIEISYFEAITSFVSRSRFTYKIGYEVGALEVDTVYFTYFIPKKIAGRIILKRVLNRVEIDIDRNLGRIRFDLLRRMEESFEVFKSDMDKRVLNLCSLIHELLTKARQDLVQKEQESEMLSNKIQILLNELNTVYSNVADILKYT